MISDAFYAAHAAMKEYLNFDQSYKVGHNITHVSRKLSKLSNDRDMPVKTEFNGVMITVPPGSAPDYAELYYKVENQKRGGTFDTHKWGEGDVTDTLNYYVGKDDTGIDIAAQNAVAISQENGKKVTFTYNGIGIAVSADTTAEKIIEFYDAEHKKHGGDSARWFADEDEDEDTLVLKKRGDEEDFDAIDAACIHSKLTGKTIIVSIGYPYSAAVVKPNTDPNTMKKEISELKYDSDWYLKARDERRAERKEERWREQLRVENERRLRESGGGYKAPAPHAVTKPEKESKGDQSPVGTRVAHIEETVISNVKERNNSVYDIAKDAAAPSGGDAIIGPEFNDVAVPQSGGSSGPVVEFAQGDLDHLKDLGNLNGSSSKQTEGVEQAKTVKKAQKATPGADIPKMI